jgi:hypothetical protein
MTTTKQPVLATVSESEMQMIIQSLIDDTGSVNAAEKWINRKLSQVYHDIETQGLKKELICLRDEWTKVQKFFSNRRRAIICSQITESKFWPH